MRIGRKAATAVAAATLSMGTLVVTAPGAEALPNNCSTWSVLQNDYMWAYSRCSSGTGTQRVKTFCSWFGGGYWAYGAWVRPGSTSVAQCGWLGSATNLGVELRN
mgnify:CR=1 FL=1